jgi:site-specific DNA recombinase
MSANSSKLRCAIYTRKSTEHGLELEFNSLDAQREACEAYIKSQHSQGWQVAGKRYDDPAFSGGNLERPALQQLMADIGTGQIDVVVVYKIDRLTRSLADFAKLVELFDSKGISFVAVTQQFNTTTSMGRLTLNVLLSFAQFERELGSERVRDKIAASRKKGKWTGGSVPLGYDNRDKKLVVNESEASTVRTIFTRYLALKSFSRLVTELDELGVVTKARRVKDKVIGGIPFTYGPLAYLLKNRTYLGEMEHGGSWFPGEHSPIVDQDTFDQVQALLRSNSVDRINRRQTNDSLLTGVIFDDRGNRMTSSYSIKNGVRYRYYLSVAILKGRKYQAGKVARVPVSEVDAAVIDALRETIPGDIRPQDIIKTAVERVVIRQDEIIIEFKPQPTYSRAPLVISWTKPKPGSLAAIEGLNESEDPRPDPQLVSALVRAHEWVRLLETGAFDSIEALALSANVHPKIVRRGIRMAFLAPDIVQAILEGSQPVNLRVKGFSETISFDWIEQRHALGFPDRDFAAA